MVGDVKVQLIICTYVFELDNVLMIHRLQQLRLLLVQLNSLFLQGLPLDDFHSDLLIGLLVYRSVHGAEGTLAEDTLKLVMIRVRLALLKLP